MTEEQKDHALADCLEAYHRQRARREVPDMTAFEARLGDLFAEFQELVAAETAIDSAMETPTTSEPLPMAWGPYTLLSELGRGAAGVVYEALHRKLGRKVALKVLRTGMDTDDTARERFQREAQALAQIRHDNIVEIFEAGEVDGRPYYAMALVNGPTLADLVKRDERPAPRALCAGMAGIADALQALHAAGIVHRDVKPSNIMLAANGRYMLADFGLARTPLAATVTRTGDALGTPLYMSPEQMLGKRNAVEARSDIYGFGATLYQALTGQPPFRTDNLHALMRMILSQRPDAPQAVAPDLPAGCSSIAMKCLEKEPQDRYASASDLAIDLRAFAAGERVAGKPLTRAQRGRRWLRHHPRWVVAALLLVGIGVFVALLPPTPATLNLSVWPPVEAQARVDDGTWMAVPLTHHRLAANKRHEIVIRTPLGGFGELHIPVTPSPNETLTKENQLLPIEDRSHPDVIDAYARAMEVASVGGLTPPRRERSVRRMPALEISFPRGKVRLEDLQTWQVHIGDDFPEGEHGWIEFFLRGEKIGAVVFPQPTEVETVGPIPGSVHDRLRPGDEVTWGFHSQTTGKLVETAAFTLVDTDLSGTLARIDSGLAGKLARIDSGLAGMEEGVRASVRATLRSALFLNHGLALAAYRESEAAAEAGHDSPYLLLLEKKALEMLFERRRDRLETTPYSEFKERWDGQDPEKVRAFLEALAARAPTK